MDTVSHHFLVMFDNSTDVDVDTGIDSDNDSTPESTASSVTWELTDGSSLYSDELVTDSWSDAIQTVSHQIGHYTVVNGIENVTVSTDSVQTLLSDCDSFDASYGILSGTVCTLVLISGVVTCFFGYRLFKGTMFAASFMFGSSIVYFICVEENVLPIVGKIGLSVGAGLLCGLTAVFIHYVGLVMIGFNFGLLLAIAGLLVVEQFYHPFTRWIPIGVTLGVGVICALCTLYWQRGLTTFGSSLFGAALMLVGVDYFLNAKRVMEYTYDRLTARPSDTTICLYGWLIIGFWPALSAAGVIVQWHITGRGRNHKNTNVPANPRRGVSAARQQQPETPDSHYRQLYRIRRINGDVISRNCMQNVQSQSSRLLNQTDESLTAVVVTDIES